MPFRLIDNRYLSGTDFHSFLFCQDGSQLTMVHHTDMTQTKRLGVSGPYAHRLLVNHTRDLDLGDPYVGMTLATLIQYTVPVTPADAFKLMRVIPRTNRAHYVWNRTRDKNAQCAAYRYIANALQDVCSGSRESSTVGYTPSSTGTTCTSRPSSCRPPSPTPSQLSNSTSDHTVISIRSHSTHPGQDDGNDGRNDGNSRHYGEIKSVINIPPWPCRGAAVGCENEASGRHEWNPPGIDNQTYSSLPEYSSVSNSTSGQPFDIKPAIYIPPWPCRVYGTAVGCGNEARGHEGNTSDIDTKSHYTIPGYSSVSTSHGDVFLNEMKRCEDVTSYGYHISESEYAASCTSASSSTAPSIGPAALKFGHQYLIPEDGTNSANGSRMSPVRDVASTSRMYSAIDTAALARLDRKTLSMEDMVQSWLANVDPGASPQEGPDCGRRCKKRKADCEDVEGASGKKRKS